MRSSFLLIFLASTSHATFFGCGVCGGLNGMGSYGGVYGGSYGGSYGSDYGMGGGYSSIGNSYSGSSYAGLLNLNAPGSYFQPMGQASITQTLYAGQPYFTPVDSGSSYGGSYGSSYGSSYGQSSPVYTQILPLPANAQIVSNIPPISQAINSQVSVVGGGRYIQPQVVRPTGYQVPPPLPPGPVQTGYVQPAAPVRPYEAVPHAVEETIEPAPAAVASETESADYSTEVTEAPVVTTTYSEPVQTYKKEENVAHMINSPQEAGYRKVLKRKRVVAA